MYNITIYQGKKYPLSKSPRLAKIVRGLIKKKTEVALQDNGRKQKKILNTNSDNKLPSSMRK